MKDRDKILLGIAGAALAGVAVGLLFYTDEGKKVRKKMKHTANDWADSMGSLWESGKENLNDLSKEAQRKYKKIKSKAAGKYENIKEGYSDLKDEYAVN